MQRQRCQGEHDVERGVPQDQNGVGANHECERDGERGDHQDECSAGGGSHEDEDRWRPKKFRRSNHPLAIMVSHEMMPYSTKRSIQI